MAKRKKDADEQELAQEILDHYTDFVDQSQYLYAYGFYLDAIEKTGRGKFYEKVLLALAMSLADIRDSGNKRVRERAFTLWEGNCNNCYWVAVPGKLSGGVNQLLSKNLCVLKEYYGTDFGSNMTMKLVPFQRYDYGRLIVYSLEEFAGTRAEYPSPKGRPPLDTYYRCWASSIRDIYGALEWDGRTNK